MKLAEADVKMHEWRFRIYPIGDMHVTLRTFDENRFKKYIRHIADDPAGIAIVMGDVSDARTPDHKFFNASMIHPRFQIEDLDILEDKAAEYASELLAPLGDKLVGVLTGNHHQVGFTHRLRFLYRSLTSHNPVDLGNRAMIRVRMIANRTQSEGVYVIFAQHRTSGGRKPGSQVNQQLDNLSSFIADLYLYGHSHRASDFNPNVYQMRARGALKLQKTRRVILTSNAWVSDVSEGVDSYPDEKGLPASSDVVYYASVRRLNENGGTSVTTPQVWEG